MANPDNPSAEPAPATDPLPDSPSSPDSPAAPPLAASELSPDIRQRTSDLMREWEAGNLTYQESVEKLEAQRREIRARGRAIDETMIEMNLGIIQGYRANYDAAILHFDRAREIAIQGGNREVIARAAMNMGETYRLKGDFTRARQFFHASYEAAIAIGVKSLQVLARINEAQMLISLGRYDQSEAMLTDCLKLCSVPWSDPETSGDQRRRSDQQCEATYGLALIYLETARLDRAWEYATATLKQSETIDGVLLKGAANRIMGQVLAAHPTSPDPAYPDNPDLYFERALELLKDIKADGEVARTLAAQGMSLAKRGNKPGAVRKLQQAMLIFTRLGMMSDAARTAQDQLKLL